MGGKTFGPDEPAARLTTDQLLQLSVFVQSRLGTQFSRMEHLRFLGDKKSHGDLDLLCAWEAPAWALEGQAPEEEKDKLASTLAQAVGAIKYKTSGSRIGSLEVHLAVPIGLLDKAVSDSEVFYQVDLLLCLPKDFDFRLFIQSYSMTSVILGQGVKACSPKLFLQEERLVLRHIAIDEVSPIVLILTTDVQALCTWLGVDYNRWSRGFANEEEYWRWTVTVPERSVLWWSWRRLAKRHRDGYQATIDPKRRNAEVPRFYVWLQTTEHAPPPELQRGSEDKDILVGASTAEAAKTVTSGTPASTLPSALPYTASQSDSSDPTVPPSDSPKPRHAPMPGDDATTTSLPAAASERSPTKDVPHDDNDRVRFRPRYRDFQPPPAVPLGTPVALIKRIAGIEAEIEKPARWDLDRGALGALNYWHMRTRYFEIVAVRREEKRVLLRAQLKNLQTRERETGSRVVRLRATVNRVVRRAFRLVRSRKAE